MSHLKVILFDTLFFSIGLLLSFHFVEYVKDFLRFHEGDSLRAIWALGVLIGISRTRIIDGLFPNRDGDSDGK